MNRLEMRLTRRPFTLICAVLLAAAILPSAAIAAPGDNAVTTWNEHAIHALTNLPTHPETPGAGNTPPVSSLHMAMVQGAVYDAVNMIDRGHQPYLDDLPTAPASASLDAAVATAAHHVLVGLVPALPGPTAARLGTLYGAFIAGLPAGASRDAGVAAGAAAAAAMLEDRADDGRFGTFRLHTGDQPGEWRETAGVNDPNGWVARVTPFTLKGPSQFRTQGPADLWSRAYAREYNEVRKLGAATGSTRTAAQTAVAMFYTESPVTMFNRTYRLEATDRGLSVVDTARLFGMLNLSIADAAIGCWDDKEFWSFWRPITAIQLGDTDGNRGTKADPTWTSLATNPPYPDHPSGYNCLAGAAIHAVKAFFGTDRMSITVHSATTNTDRTYPRLTRLLRDTIDARVYLGLHFRSADVDGAWLGRKTAQWVARQEFRAVN